MASDSPQGKRARMMAALDDASPFRVSQLQADVIVQEVTAGANVQQCLDATRAELVGHPVPETFFGAIAIIALHLRDGVQWDEQKSDYLLGCLVGMFGGGLGGLESMFGGGLRLVAW